MSLPQAGDTTFASHLCSHLVPVDRRVSDFVQLIVECPIIPVNSRVSDFVSGGVALSDELTSLPSLHQSGAHSSRKPLGIVQRFPSHPLIAFEH